MKHLSAFELIGIRYLDTEHEATLLRSVDAELSRRNIVGIRRIVLDYIAASAFWWNILWWDEASLGGKDVLFGWSSNLAAFGLCSVLVGVFLGNMFGLLAFLFLHLATTRLGFKMRATA
ncbi:hypothetical protein HPT27_11375 [Permianibacter sp. IMCC34836]|uniref:hypothetical protein n=1 Tax=Permianibacter fluminis TaxID=2738515 RepID=UPI001553DD49|nr:hypothetical protein [Permianibacter fluminis]NQD37626.1 hypothetical protein [Permianibacter fluminis]